MVPEVSVAALPLFSFLLLHFLLLKCRFSTELSHFWTPFRLLLASLGSLLARLELLLAALGPLLARFPALGTSPPRVESLLLNPNESGPELLCYLSLYPWD